MTHTIARRGRLTQLDPGKFTLAAEAMPEPDHSAVLFMKPSVVSETPEDPQSNHIGWPNQSLSRLSS